MFYNRGDGVVEYGSTAAAAAVAAATAAALYYAHER